MTVVGGVDESNSHETCLMYFHTTLLKTIHFVARIHYYGFTFYSESIYDV